MSEAFIVPPHDSDTVVYRGEFALPGIDSIMSWGQAIYFGDQYTANRYTEHKSHEQPDEVAARIYPCRLDIRKPFINQPTDSFLELTDIAKRFGQTKAMKLALKFESAITETDNWQRIRNGRSFSEFVFTNFGNVEGLYFDAYRLFRDPEEVKWLMALGYDGAIHQGNGWGSAQRPEYCVFDRSQIRSIFE